MKNLYSTYTDDEIIRLFSTGDHVAFTELYNRYWERLFYRAGKKTGDVYVAEELVQDIFVDLWKRREKLFITGELSHYLAAALKYRIINLQTKRSRMEQYIQSQVSQYNEESSTSEWVYFRLLEERVNAAIAELPEKCRFAFQLRQEGYSQKEIAEKMQISENTVERHIDKALKNLRTNLKDTKLLIFFLLP